MLSAAFGLIGVVIGVAGTLFAQRLQGKEKFKEILYKERLSVYKEILKRLSQIHLVMSKYQTNIMESEIELAKVKGEAVDLLLAITGGAGVVSDEVFNRGLEIAVLVSNADDLKTIFIKLGEPSPRLVKAIRKELGVKKLSDEIIATFNFPSTPSYKPFKGIFKKRGRADNPIERKEEYEKARGSD